MDQKPLARLQAAAGEPAIRQPEAFFRLLAGNLAAALKDLDQAIALEPKNTRYAQVRASLAAGRK